MFKSNQLFNDILYFNINLFRNQIKILGAGSNIQPNFKVLNNLP